MAVYVDHEGPLAYYSTPGSAFGFTGLPLQTYILFPFEAYVRPFSQFFEYEVGGLPSFTACEVVLVLFSLTPRGMH